MFVTAPPKNRPRFAYANSKNSSNPCDRQYGWQLLQAKVAVARIVSRN